MNQKMKYSGILLILPLLTVTVVSFTELPSASALTKRDDTSPNDQHCTARITCSGLHSVRVCGDHTCSPGEYSKLRAELSKEQSAKIIGKIVPTHPSTQGSSTTQTGTTNIKPVQSDSVLKLSQANLPLVIPLVRL